MDYDALVFGADRSKALADFIRRAPQLACYYEKNNRISGFCLGRPGRKTTHIGPVVADNLEIASDLLLSVLSTCADGPVSLDTTLHQPGWNRSLFDLGFKEMRPITRMFLGEANLPEHHWKQLAVAGPEMG